MIQPLSWLDASPPCFTFFWNIIYIPRSPRGYNMRIGPPYPHARWQRRLKWGDSQNNKYWETLSYTRFMIHDFYTPVFRRDVLWYGDVHPGLRPSVRVSVRLFSTLFSYMLWHIELKFCTSLCFNVLQIKFECRHFASIFKGVMPLLELRI